MFFSRLQRSFPKFVENRKKILYKTKFEAAKDFWKVSGASILAQLGLAFVLLEFGFPSPDVVFEAKKMISPDFAMFTEFGRVAEFDIALSNNIRGLRMEKETIEYQQSIRKEPGAKFGTLS